MGNGPILIQGAMHTEVEIFLEALKNKERVCLNGYEFYSGNIGSEMVVVSITKIGMVNCAVATITGIMYFKPKCVINQGVAGSHSANVHRGEVVIGEFAINMNSYETPLLKLGEGIRPENWKLVTFKEGDNIEKEKLKANDDLINKVESFMSDKFVFHKGTIASGDCWNKEYDRILWFSKEVNSLAEDMESYAVYKVCVDNDVPALGIRVISNNELTGESYEKELGKELQKVLVEMIIGEM